MIAVVMMSDEVGDGDNDIDNDNNNDCPSGDKESDVMSIRSLMIVTVNDDDGGAE